MPMAIRSPEPVNAPAPVLEDMLRGGVGLALGLVHGSTT
jgi:hypothetical protein